MAKLASLYEESLFLGIDGGGSKCRARIFSAANQELGAGIGGPANPIQGVQQTINSITEATELALVNAGLPASSISQLIAGVGLAGVNLPSLFQTISNWQHPFQKMFLTTDLHIACLAAHNSAEGAVIVAGTGSCGYALVNNVTTILGGHGFPFGDQGSGAWMGLEAIKAVLLASDKLGPATLMSEPIENFLQAKGVMIVDKMIAAKASDYAQLAVFVLEAAQQQDPVALTIIKDGAAYLSAIAEQLWQTGVARMSFIGGLSAHLTPWLAPHIAARLAQPFGQPEYGAAYYAQQQFNLLIAK